MEQDTIRARSIELVNEHGGRGLVLDGGGGDREPGLVVYGPGGQSAVAIIVRREDGVPVVMATSAAGDGDPGHLRPRRDARRQRPGYGRRGPQGLPVGWTDNSREEAARPRLLPSPP